MCLLACLLALHSATAPASMLYCQASSTAKRRVIHHHNVVHAGQLENFAMLRCLQGSPMLQHPNGGDDVDSVDSTPADQLAFRCNIGLKNPPSAAAAPSDDSGGGEEGEVIHPSPQTVQVAGAAAAKAKSGVP